jgi:23S rRNA pseudouridine1911/1915/1917 synthase
LNKEKLLEKAYKLLAVQEGISNAQAKKMIDDGLVYVADKKVQIARALINPKSRFRILRSEKAVKVFEDENIIAVSKPAFLVSETLEKVFKAKLLHRLDKETSGLLILVKNEEFRLKAIEEFKAHRVYKEYVALVSGIISEETVIDDPIKTVKGHKAKSSVSKHGQSAETMITPLTVQGKKTKIQAVITTGRTHQIRVHLAHRGHPIIGDAQYGGRHHTRMMLHSKRIKLFDYDLSVDEPKEFNIFMDNH